MDDFTIANLFALIYEYMSDEEDRKNLYIDMLECYFNPEDYLSISKRFSINDPIFEEVIIELNEESLKYDEEFEMEDEDD